jgi:predicted HTH transcriptional regulator
MTKISKEKIEALLKLKDDKSLYHRESRDLEFKEQFNLAGLAEYFRDFAAFSNCIGGYLIFGVTNSPRKLVGLSDSSVKQFEKIDPEKITGYLLDIFSPDIQWEQELFQINGKHFGVFYVHESKHKPIIAKKRRGSRSGD